MKTLLSKNERTNKWKQKEKLLRKLTEKSSELCKRKKSEVTEEPYEIKTTKGINVGLNNNYIKIFTW